MEFTVWWVERMRNRTIHVCMRVGPFLVQNVHPWSWPSLGLCFLRGYLWEVGSQVSPAQDRALNQWISEWLKTKMSWTQLHLLISWVAFSVNVIRPWLWTLLRRDIWDESRRIVGFFLSLCFPLLSSLLSFHLSHKHNSLEPAEFDIWWMAQRCRSHLRFLKALAHLQGWTCLYIKFPEIESGFSL